MLDKLKQLLQSGGSRGPRPSGLCLWHDLPELSQLAAELASEAAGVSNWEEVRQQVAARKTTV